MKAIAAVIMMACFFWGLPAPSQGQAENPGMTARKTVEIPVAVIRDKIDLGEKYAIAARIGATVTWTSPGFPFAVQFEPDAPFKLVRNDKTWSMKVSKEARPYHVYKYTIAVCAGRDILILDPIFIPLPPEG